MERLFARLEQLLLPLLAALLAFITLGVFVQVVLRYVFSTSFLWAEELSLFAFIWCVYLGAAICTWRRTHFAFDLLGEASRGRLATLQRVLVDVVVLVIALVLLVEGWAFAQLSIQRLSPALGITLFVPTLAIPVSGALMVLALAAEMLQDCRMLWTGRK